MQIYLDNNASTKTLKSVNDLVSRSLCRSWANPSSPHGFGREVLNEIQKAREVVANFVGVGSHEVYFVSSGTEANNIVIRSGLIDRDRVFVTSVVEHSSVLKLGARLEEEGFTVIYLGVDRGGKVCLDELEKLVSNNNSFVSIQSANSETGVIQPINEICAICRRHGAIFHSDGAQFIGREKLNILAIGLDYFTFSAHKLHSLKGSGVICARNGSLLSPILFGGEQERGVLPGTENTLAILSLANAIQERQKTFEECRKKLKDLSTLFLTNLTKLSPSVGVNVDPQFAVPNTLSLHFPGVDSLALVSNLSNEGVYCSHTSACLSARPEPSYVLVAMGIGEKRASESIRVSFSVLNTEEEAIRASELFSATYDRLRIRFEELFI